MKSLKYNGQFSPKKEEMKSEDLEEVKTVRYRTDIGKDNLKFCFEKIPSNTPWYKAFQRVDQGEQRYHFFNDCKSLSYLWLIIFNP